MSGRSLVDIAHCDQLRELDFEMPLWIALLGAVGVGVVLMLTILAVHARRRRRIRRRRDAAGRLRRAVARGRPQADPGS